MYNNVDFRLSDDLGLTYYSSNFQNTLLFNRNRILLDKVRDIQGEGNTIIKPTKK